MQKKITGFLIATVLFNAIILLTVYFTEFFSREVSVIWSWLVFLIMALAGGALLSTMVNKLKLGYKAGVFAFFWSIFFVVILRFYYRNYNDVINARISEPLEVANATKVKSQYDYFRFKDFSIEQEKLGYELKKDSLVEKSDPKKGTFHYYVAPLTDAKVANQKPTVFIGKHYIGIEPDYKETFQKRLKKKPDFFVAYPNSFTFQGAVKSVNPQLTREKNYLILMPAFSPFEMQKSSLRHFLVLLLFGNVLWSVVILVMQRSKQDN
ncbi:hypothetical protein BKI52_25705 [marine bacterium AO1-C]|nr:hypothetical protein BKI52_25705 [marine bacterium AO1-C]